MAGLRIAFMGTPDFAASALQALLDCAHEVVCVYSQPPRPKGRGHKVQPSPVHMLAKAHNIPVFTPKSLKNEAAQAEFAAHNVDVAVVAAYGLILPKAILDAPKYGCLNIHASLLPRWRGAAPIQRAIEAGDAQSGVTIMQMDEGLDTGPMILKGEVPITPETSAVVLHDALADMGGKLIVQSLDKLAAKGKMEAEKQDDALACYAHMLGKEDGRVDWSRPGADILRQVRAFTPWPGVWSEIGGQRFKILDVALTDERVDSEPGVIFDRSGSVSCGAQSVLKLLNIQPAGKKPMDFASALNGGYVSVGDVFT
jgi:methionyl-tRNA formyltransferase